MNKIMKILCSIALFFSTCILGIGYASLTDELKLEGYAEGKILEVLFISDVEVYSATRATSSSLDFGESYGYTNLKTTFVKTGSNYQTSNIVYKISVTNNTKYKYSYIGIDYSSNSGYNGNSLIGSNNGIRITTSDSTTNNSSFNENDSINPGETITFYAFYTFGRSVTRNTTYNTFVNYKFGIHVDSKYDYIVEKMYTTFDEILNDTSAGGKYELLSDVINDKYTGGGYGNLWRATYIGNVGGSSSDDSENVRKLFGDDLILSTSEGDVYVTLLIKHEDVDNNENTGDSYELGSGNDYISAKGCEYTLYMTVDDLYQYGASVTVYSAVFTCDTNEDGTIGEWYILGDTVEGTAPVIGYEGQDSTGSFHTDRWYTVARTYFVSDNYSYTLPAGQTIFTVTQEYDDNANTAFQEMLDEANRLIYEQEYAGSAMIKLKDVYYRAAKYYNINEDGSVTLKSRFTRSQIIPIMEELYTSLRSFEGLY